MSGAIKPPWIDKDSFYKMPFNFCDRWCEKCRLTKICRVFLNEQKSRKKFLKQGKDPDSIESSFAMIKESFEKTRKLIEKDAKRLGINLSEIKDSDYHLPPEPEQFPLYNLVSKFSERLEKILKDLEMIPLEADVELVLENREIISYYRFLIMGKVYRALTSRIEEEKDKDDLTFDAQTSAFIAIHGLMSISKALVNFGKHKPLKLLKSEFLKLAKISLDLTKTIEEKFDI